MYACLKCGDVVIQLPEHGSVCGYDEYHQWQTTDGEGRVDGYKREEDWG